MCLRNVDAERCDEPNNNSQQQLAVVSRQRHTLSRDDEDTPTIALHPEVHILSSFDALRAKSIHVSSEQAGSDLYELRHQDWDESPQRGPGRCPGPNFTGIFNGLWNEVPQTLKLRFS